MSRIMIISVGLLFLVQPMLQAWVMPRFCCLPASSPETTTDADLCCGSAPIQSDGQPDHEQDPDHPDAPDGPCPKVCCATIVVVAHVRALSTTMTASGSRVMRIENQQDPHARAHAIGLEHPPRA